MRIKQVLLAAIVNVLLSTTVEGGRCRRPAGGGPAFSTAELDQTIRTGSGQNNQSPSAGIHPEARCGEQPDGKIYVCQTGYCCSGYGFCGETKEHCGEGCRFGNCENRGGAVTSSASSNRRLSTSSALRTFRTCKTKGHVALTFDDGPGFPTSRLLDILDKAQATATFFVRGSRVDTNTGGQLVKRAFEANHTIGTHSFSHPDFTTLSASEINEEMDKTIEVVTKVLDGRKPRFFRFPFGEKNLASRRAISHYIDIEWNVDSNDWRSRDADTIVADVTRKLHEVDSAIVVLHDIHDFSVDSVERLIQQTREMDFKFVSMEECVGLNAYEWELEDC